MRWAQLNVGFAGMQVEMLYSHACKANTLHHVLYEYLFWNLESIKIAY